MVRVWVRFSCSGLVLTFLFLTFQVMISPVLAWNPLQHSAQPFGAMSQFGAVSTKYPDPCPDSLL